MSAATIEVKITNAGYYFEVVIVSVEYGFSQMLKDGKWVNTSIEPKRFETEILTIGKRFNEKTDAEAFLKTKFFKDLHKAVLKNFA